MEAFEMQTVGLPRFERNRGL